ncbi:molybdenum cofactor biosynthesis protein MoeA [Streptomyces globisporus C-1027]|uniref:Molybdopterin molybdenumtransferase n=1 Tax=Streptomyces globisporus C-1027 TaxID=1172567 RepID=A0A0U3LZ12_STRGL|nr:molybdopterin molybdotransferase MoeA [Streptomyces globisporus]ALU94867.1 molybdenum cofactor biosynthesis protein MoeA [Streptomyces globisporus C-1027]
MTGSDGPHREPGSDVRAPGSASERAREEEERAVEQALALVGGSGRSDRSGGSGEPASRSRDSGGHRGPRDEDLNAGRSSNTHADRSRDPHAHRSSDSHPYDGRDNDGRDNDGRDNDGRDNDRRDDDRRDGRATPATAPAPGSEQPPLPERALPGDPAKTSPPPPSWDRARAVAARAGRGRPPATIRLALDRALGHVLAEALGALTDLPSFDTSAMDGWAVAGPGPWAFEAGAGLLAGRSPAAALPDGTAVRIATGARVPPETTAVIRSEHAHVDEARGLLHARRSVVTGQDIRPRGQECRSGEQLVPAGTVVTPAVLGLAAAAGYDALPVVPRPRVDILVLGDELLNAGLPHDGLIRDALGPMLGPWLRALGAEVSGARRLGDDAGALRDALTSSDADLIVTTGGTAAGPVDHVHPVLDALGAELLVDGVAVRPGHPMLLARLSPDGPYLVGLPGNPLAAVSGLLTLAEPLLAGIAGRPAQDPYRALVHAEVHGHPHDTRLVPVVHRPGRAGGRDHVAPLRYNGPAMLRGIAAADGLAVVPPGGVRSGTEVEILDLPWAPATPWTEGCFT